MKAGWMRKVMWRSCIASILFAGACVGSEDDMFDPLARANIHLNGRIVDFDRAADTFAAKEGFTIARANFPKDGRSIDNIRIDADCKRKTFLILNNFRNEEIMEVAILSHEGESKWKKIWHSFIQMAVENFGENNVKLVNEPNPSR